MAENHKDSFAELERTENPALTQKRDALRGNTELYTVKSGDTVASIAHNRGIEDYNDLLALNRLMGHGGLESNGKNGTRILIRPGDTVFIPKNIDQFRFDIESVKKISEAIVENRLVAEGNREALKKEINEGIFPQYRQSLGMHRLNDGLLGNMQSSLHLGGPRQVDPKFERDASCAHYYRQELRSAFNIGDMPKEWKKFMNTGAIDAWELPARLLHLKNGDRNEFVQKENFMGYFDTSKFGGKTSPIASGKEDEYAHRMIALNDYLRDNPNAVNTAIPVYYKHSRYQLQGLLQAHAGGEKHYNTHMMRYIGTTPSVFPAYEWGEVHPDGTVTPFGVDRKHIDKETKTSKERLAQERTVYEDHKRILLEHVKNELATHVFIIDGKVERYVRIWQERQEIRVRKGQKGDNKSPEAVKEELTRLFSSGDIAQVCSKLPGIIDYPVSEEDARYLIGLQRNKRRATEGMKQIQEALTNAREGQYPSFDKKDYAVLFFMDERLSQALSDYNSSALRASGYTDTIRTNEEKMKSEKKIPVIEYLLNFLQQRADYGESAIKAEWRKQIAEGLAKYAGAVSMKVNGKPVDIAAELKKSAKDQIVVHPEDMIELSGPVMSDGFHIHTLKDPVEREKMQGRQRFFFELLATQTFFPSETIEPTPGSLMHRTEFRATTDAVKTKGTYSLNRGDTLEHTIKRLVPIYERAEFEELVPDSPEYKQWLQKHYALQIKGLQMLGLMQSNYILNPGAVKINEAIPYFDTTDISKKYSDYIQAAKAKKLSDSKETAPYKEYLDVQVFPGDTYANLFARIAKNLENYASHFDKYPNLQHIGGFNDYLRKEFLQRFVASSIKSDESADWEKLLAGEVKPGAKFLLGLDRVDAIAGELRNISYTPSIDNILKKVDADVLDMVVPTAQNKHIIESTMYVESYEQENGHQFIPNGTGLWYKQHMEDILSSLSTSENVPQHAKQWLKKRAINSYGDFQLRGLESLERGFGKEWVTKAQLEHALGLLDRPDIQSYIVAFSKGRHAKSASVKEDMWRVHGIQELLKKEPPAKEDFERISGLLREIVRLDDGTSSNIVGKIVGASLINDKINGHFQKLDGVLEAVNDPVWKFANDPEKMARHEDAVFVINNMGEKQAMLGFAENYLYRILEKIHWKDKVGYSTLKLSRSNWFFRTLWWNGRGLDYKTADFVGNIEHIMTQIAPAGRSETETRILQRISQFWEEVKNIHQNFIEKRHLLLTDIDRMPDEAGKTSLREQWKSTYEQEDGEILSRVYALVSDSVFKEGLSELKVDTSILPTKEEISARDSFHGFFFNHARKGNEIESKAKNRRSEWENGMPLPDGFF